MTTLAPALPLQATSTAPLGTRRTGPSRRLTAAFQAMDEFPALAESQQRVIARASEESFDAAPLVAAIEADVALTASVMRAANEVTRLAGETIQSVVDAVATLAPATIIGLTERLPTFDFFDRSSVWQDVPERVRLHALATQRAAGLIATRTRFPGRDRLMVTALLHDIGQIVLLRAYPEYSEMVHVVDGTPEERIALERAELGIDHAMVGGVLARRWGFPPSLATPIERHHAAPAAGESAHIRLADMLAHYAQGDEVSATEMTSCAQTIGLDLAAVRSLMCDVSHAPRGADRKIVPCPLSTRELDVLRQLETGMVYKQIAAAMGLSTSTIRSHLHNTYSKLDTPDRAHAVLKAKDLGWL